jgi:hypothetical protein
VAAAGHTAAAVLTCQLHLRGDGQTSGVLTAATVACTSSPAGNDTAHTSTGANGPSVEPGLLLPISGNRTLLEPFLHSFVGTRWVDECSTPDFSAQYAAVSGGAVPK